MIVMESRRQWINFARYSSPPIGKGRILHCEIQDDNLVMDMTLDGVRFIGTLHQVKEEEE
tara:strand:+ start:104 stop:283 length:180 start_codon:yes stop_codon:yes gene_type:complete